MRAKWVGLLLLAACPGSQSGADGASPADLGSPDDTGGRDAAPRDAPAADRGGDFDGSADAQTPWPDAEVDAGSACAIGFEDTVTAVLRLTADDDRRVFVNEREVDSFDRQRTWQTATTTTVRLFRHPARANLIAVHVENYFRVDGRDRGLLLELTSSGTAAVTLVSDSRWRVSPVLAAGFEAFGFDDRGWTSAVEQVRHPGGPWGAVLGVSSAAWVWFYDSNLGLGEKEETETMLARRVFYWGEGGILDEPGECR